MNFASAFSRVCNTAVERGWVSERVPLPKLSRRGGKGSVRPAFSAEEIAKLRVFMAAWEGAAKLDWDQMQRPLLCDYVEFLLLTGMRHGTESMRVHWRDCEWYEADGVKYLRVRVSGKTGERYLIAKHEALAVLQRLHVRQADIAGRDFDAVLGRANLLLFRNAVGVPPRQNSCRLHRTKNPGAAMKDDSGSIRTIIQEQGGGDVAAAGERSAGRGGAASGCWSGNPGLRAPGLRRGSPRRP